MAQVKPSSKDLGPHVSHIEPDQPKEVSWPGLWEFGVSGLAGGTPIQAPATYCFFLT